MPSFRRPESSYLPIVSGGDQTVFIDKNNDEVVMKRHRDDAFEADFEKTPDYVKATHYLNKIIAALFPKNVPDTRESGVRYDKETGKPVVESVHDRKFLQPASPEKLKYFKSQLSGGEPRVAALQEEFDHLGLDYDEKPLNWELEEKDKDTIIYVDTFKPVEYLGGRLLKRYQTGPILRSIEKLSDEQQKENCKNWLKRLEKLVSSLDKNIKDHPELLK